MGRYRLAAWMCGCSAAAMLGWSLQRHAFAGNEIPPPGPPTPPLQIKPDLAFGTPMFETLAGRSQCPYELGTLQRQMAEISVLGGQNVKVGQIAYHMGQAELDRHDVPVGTTHMAYAYAGGRTGRPAPVRALAGQYAVQSIAVHIGVNCHACPNQGVCGAPRTCGSVCTSSGRHQAGRRGAVRAAAGEQERHRRKGTQAGHRTMGVPVPGRHVRGRHSPPCVAAAWMASGRLRHAHKRHNAPAAAAGPCTLASAGLLLRSPHTLRCRTAAKP